MSDQHSSINDLDESDEWVVYNSPKKPNITDSEQLLTKAITILTKTEQLQTKLSEQINTIQNILSKVDHTPTQNVRDYNRSWRSYGNNPYLPYLGNNIFTNFPISKPNDNLSKDNLVTEPININNVLPSNTLESSDSSDNEIQ